MPRDTDQFNSNQDALKQTRSLSARPTQVTREGILTSFARAAQAVNIVEERIELLMRACEAAKVGVPGLEKRPYLHPVSPKGVGVVRYLVEAFAKDPALTRLVQVAVFRFYEAKDAIEEAKRAIEEDDPRLGLVEELGRRSYYLMHYYKDFAGDQVLAQLFPAPAGEVSQQEGSVRAQTEGEKLVQERRYATQVMMSKRVTANSGPLVEVIRPVLALRIETNPLMALLRADTIPTDRVQRMLYDRLKEQPDLRPLLERLVAAHDAAEAAIRTGGQSNGASGQGSMEELKTTSFKLGNLAQRCRTHPSLNDILMVLRPGATRPLQQPPPPPQPPPPKRG